MSELTQPFIDEHMALMQEVEVLKQVSSMVGVSPLITLHEQLDALCEFLTHRLQPHAQAEEQVFYPLVAKLMGSTEITDLMQCEHLEMAHFINELNIVRARLSETVLPTTQANQLRHVLNGLYRILKGHFAREENVFFPLIDQRLTPEGARDLFDRMEQIEFKAQRVPAA